MNIKFLILLGLYHFFVITANNFNPIKQLNNKSEKTFGTIKKKLFASNSITKITSINNVEVAPNITNFISPIFTTTIHSANLLINACPQEQNSYFTNYIEISGFVTPVSTNEKISLVQKNIDGC